MTSKNKVDVTIKGNKNTGVFAGGTVGHPSVGDSKNEVKAIIEGEHNQSTIAGADIDQISQIDSVLSELVGLLIDALKEKSDKEYIQEIINQLKDQANKPESERNKSKINGVLNNLSSYIGLVGLAVSHAEKIKALYEQVLRFFN